MYVNGYGVTQDYTQAREWYLKAAKQGYADAQNNLGFFYENGHGVTRDYTQAREWYLKAAEQGNSDGQNNLGRLYHLGEGVTQDYVKAKDWYLKSAEQGHGPAQVNLGILYSNGYGVTQDYAKAKDWYLQAAGQGNLVAQVNLGIFYENGSGVTQDYVKAREWYLKAAEQGDSDAQNSLGTLYYAGNGVTQDYAKAREWFLEAAKQGNSDGQSNLGRLYHLGDGIAQDVAKAREWYLKSAEQGNAYGQIHLGNLYYEGKGVAQDYTKARTWYLKAANQGNAESQFNLGKLYANGHGVAIDVAEASDWYFKAAKQGNADALHALTMLAVEAFPSPEAIKMLQDSISDNYFSEPIKSNFSIYENFSLESLYLMANLANEDWRKYFLSLDENFNFEKNAALERLAQLVKFPHGVKLLENLTSNFRLFTMVDKDEFQPVIDALVKNVEGTNSTLRRITADFLALYYDDGYLEPQNSVLAEKYFNIAAEAGSQFAQSRIAWIFLNSGNYDEAIRYLSLSARNNYDTNLQLQALNDLALAQILKGVSIQTIVDNFETSAELASRSSLEYYYPAENLVRIYLSEKYGVPKNLKKAEKYSNLMKAEGHKGILLDAFEAMRNDDQLKLIDFMETYDDQSSAAFEKAVYHLELNPSEAFKNFIICGNISTDADEQSNCVSMAALMKAKIPGEMAYMLEKEARTKQIELLAALGSNETVKTAEDKGDETGNQYALLISNSNYDNLSDLSSPKNDTRELSEILKLNYGYNIELISNASRREIIKSFNELRGKLEPEDNLIVYYAGHGKSDGDTSFWLPREAFPEDDTDWIEDSTIERKIGQMKARNVLVIADSCFSGNLTRGVDIVTIDTNQEVLKTYRNTISRVAITSGGDEPILDRGPSGHSIFAAALIDFLKSQKTSFTAQELSFGISERVLKTSIEYGLKQTPSYGQLFNAGHVGLDFVFTPEK